MKMHVKKNDEVVVLAGNDRGKKGKVIAVDPQNGRVSVQGVRMIKKAMRKSQDRPQGGFMEREGFIHASNVALVEAAASDAKPSKKN